MSRSSHQLAALAAFAVAIALAAPASADKYLFSGTHTIRFSHNGVIKEVSKSVTVAENTGVAIVNRAGADVKLNTLELTRAFAKITATVMGDELGTALTAPISNEVVELRFKGVQIDPDRVGLKGLPKGPPSGIFRPIHGALTRSTLPAEGTIRLCFATGCPTTDGTVRVDLVQHDTTSTGPMTMTYAIGPGVGMSFTAMGMTGTVVSVMGNPWKINTAQASWVKKDAGVVMLTSMGFVKGPGGMTGTTLASTGGMMHKGGMVQLVTPIQTTCVGACGSANNPAAQISRLTITFEPEPGLLAMLGAGAVGVALLGRKRIRR